MSGPDASERTETSDSAAGQSPGSTEEESRTISWLKPLIFLLIMVAGIYLFIVYDLRSTFEYYFNNSIEPWIEKNPITGRLAYVGIYISGVVAFIPGSAMTLPGGALFGPIWGTVIVSIASTTGAGFAFLVGRYLARDWVEKKAGKTLDSVQEGIKNHGWAFVAFTRLVPVFPFNLQNYVYGLTRINFWTYISVSWVAMLPGTFAWVYFGYAAKKLAASGAGIWKTFITISIAAGLLILVSFIPKLVRFYSSVEVERDDEMEDEEE